MFVSGFATKFDYLSRLEGECTILLEMSCPSYKPRRTGGGEGITSFIGSSLLTVVISSKTYLINKRESLIDRRAFETIARPRQLVLYNYR